METQKMSETAHTIYPFVGMCQIFANGYNEASLLNVI